MNSDLKAQLRELNITAAKVSRAAGSERQAMGSGHWAAGNGQRAAGNGQRAAGRQARGLRSPCLRGVEATRTELRV